MDTADRASAIQATMSLRQKVLLLSRRATSTRAAIASWLVGRLVDTMTSRSLSDKERACAACSSGVMIDSEVDEIGAWYLLEHGRLCAADDDKTTLTDHGLAVKYAGQLLRHVNALEMSNVGGHRHAATAAQRQPAAVCPRGPTR